METSGPTPESQRTPPKPTPWLGCVLVVGILFVLAAVSLGPMNQGGIKKAPESASVQMSHALGLALFSYANDNNQTYPDTSSSTEAFQKLLDGGYITDPTILYIPMPGKVKPVAGQKLKPENVCWDITAPVEATSGVDLPLLFTTGYKINYIPGGAATPIIKPYPRYWTDESSSSWFGSADGYSPSAGLAVFYVNNSACFVLVAPDNSIPKVVPPDFKPDGKTYHQLTPDGVLR